MSDLQAKITVQLSFPLLCRKLFYMKYKPERDKQKCNTPIVTLHLEIEKKKTLVPKKCFKLWFLKSATAFLSESAFEFIEVINYLKKYNLGEILDFRAY